MRIHKYILLLLSASTKLKVSKQAYAVLMYMLAVFNRGYIMIDWKNCEDKANKVLKKYGIRVPLVNVFEIAQYEGMNIVYFKPTDEKQRSISGFLDEGKNTIYLNNDDSPERQSFTIAHELGHYFLKHQPDKYSVYYRNSLYKESKADIEKEADKFAASLLMPKALVTDAQKKYNLTADDSLLLSKIFGVSQTAMMYRLKSMDEK